MAIDINMLRESKGGNPEVVRESQRKRFKNVEVVDEVIELDQQFVKKQYEVSQLKRQLNAASKSFGIAKKQNDEEKQKQLTEEIKQIKDQIAKDEQDEAELSKQRDQKLHSIGNILRPEVPISQTEDDNVVRCQFFPQNYKQENKSHIDLFSKLSGTDCERGVKCAGGRGYFLSGFGALLNSAVIAYAQQFLAMRGYIIMQTPFFLERDMMAKAAELADFDDQLYKVTGEGNDKYLIATSEQTLCSYFSGEVIDFVNFNKKFTNYKKSLVKPLPREEPIEGDYFNKKQSLENPKFDNTNTIMFAGYSSCFRKEAGKHGKDMLGIFRVHQFEKIEQLIVTQPQFSDELHYYMINTAREFYESLNIPYRVVEIVSSAFNDAAARKFDLEGWFPGSKAYRELVSCSNCTDYQARNLDIKFQSKNNSREYCHLLNSTLCATERFLCCLVENWCDEEGFVVPPPLRPYMEGAEKFYFEN